MATLVLQMAGAALGGMLGPVGAIAGRAIGGLAGAMVDRALLGGSSASGASAPLKDLDVTASTEGAGIPRVYGRGRVSGQIVWATRLEAVRERRSTGGGKGGVLGGGGGSTTEKVSYFANLAIGLCEGPIAAVRRVWADGKLLDLEGAVMRVHPGGEGAEPDPLIVAKEGADRAPGYRGLAYVVFERLPLEQFGNRVPQFAFEVLRPVGRLESMVRAVTMIPGSTEFGYDTRTVLRDLGLGASEPENRHVSFAATDWTAAVDELAALCPNLQHVSLVVAWFGDDLRCGRCTVTPRVDRNEKATVGASWSVAGLTRETALPVSEYLGRPAYGGTPSDESVLAAIRDLKARGYSVTVYPFLLMDIPAGNSLADPRTGTAPQPPHPWRGTMTCDPAPEVSGTVDATPAAADQVAAFFGTAQAAHYTAAGNGVAYSGPDEWSWRRFVLHLAMLSEIAGGVDTFVIGSEFHDLTRIRSASGVYPATAHLRALAAEARAILGAGCKITYAADWTEYGAHVLGGGAEVRFPLDPLWADANIDAVGIDWYAPVSDWRDGQDHLDAQGVPSGYDLDYLRANVTAGEAFDWYYASIGERAAQVRAPITDGLGKPWVFRVKDLEGWWSNLHHERAGGAELGQPTAWVPASKPIWLTETGCPAVDKGANSPNLFPDPKSSAAGLPFASSGERDDLMPRRMLEAVIERWDPARGQNPVSPVYGGRMLDLSRIYLWTWDARPWPVFPQALGVWADGESWQTGHWLNGRFGQAPIAELCAEILREAEVPAYDPWRLEGVVDGCVIDRPASPREVLEPLSDLFAFGAWERDGAIVLGPRGRGAVLPFATDDLVVEKNAEELGLVRGQESELPVEVALGFTDVMAEFRPSVATARRGVAGAGGIVATDTPLVASRGEMTRRAEVRLQDLWVQRESARFSLPPGAAGLEPGDLVRLEVDGEGRLYEAVEIADGPTRRVEARAIAPAILSGGRPRDQAAAPPLPAVPGPATVLVLDLPAAGGEPPVLSRAAVAASPWPGGVVLWREAGGSYEPAVTVPSPAIIGETLGPLASGPAWRFDPHASVAVRVGRGPLIGAGCARVLAGANLAAIEGPDGGWEILQFAEAELVAPNVWRLSDLVRGVSGTEALAGIVKPAGSRFVLLDGAVVPLVTGTEAVGRTMRWRAAAVGRDHADPFAVPFSATPGENALAPRAPVHPRASRGAEGITLRWIGRSRLDDPWDLEPRLDQPEAWRIEILAGGMSVRGLESDGEQVLYPNADEAADFGIAQSQLAIRIAQVSPLTGLGPALERIVHVR